MLMVYVFRQVKVMFVVFYVMKMVDKKKSIMKKISKISKKNVKKILKISCFFFVFMLKCIIVVMKFCYIIYCCNRIVFMLIVVFDVMEKCMMCKGCKLYCVKGKGILLVFIVDVYCVKV